MTFDPDFIKNKFECQLAQVCARKLKYDYYSWHLSRKNNHYQLDGSGLVYPLGILIEGRYHSIRRSELNVVAAVLGMSLEEVQAFHSGFSTRGVSFGLLDKVQNLGVEIRNKLDPIKPNTNIGYTFSTTSTANIVGNAYYNFGGNQWRIVNQ